MRHWNGELGGKDKEVKKDANALASTQTAQLGNDSRFMSLLTIHFSPDRFCASQRGRHDLAVADS
ncbi:hypothetical protein NKDENANG_00277 [Candidatus Entotheonellaceae bacterium PAL068K]